MLATNPERKLTRTGVPCFSEIAPNQRGAAPSKPDTASARSEPIIQATPDESVQRMKSRAANPPRNAPAPVNVATPSDEMLPPKTVNTVLIASINPPKLVT